jgi:hypothetical protein
MTGPPQLEARLRRRMRELAIELLGSPAREAADELRFGNKGGLWVGHLRGVWIDFSADRQPRGPLELIQRVRDCDRREAAQWARRWLEGCSDPDPEAPNEDTEAEQAARSERVRGIARGWLGQLLEVTGTPGETYLRSRGLEPPYPACVRFLERTDRTGEGAVVAVLTDEDGEAVALQLGYVDARGAKSTIEPPRKLWPLVEHWSERGLLRIQPAARDEQSSSEHGEADPVEALRRAATEAAGKPFLEEDVALLTEGLEDALALRCLGHPIYAFTSVGNLGKVAPPEPDVTIVRDGDPPGSEADRAVTWGADRLLLAGRVVAITQTPLGEDANSVWQSADDGRKSLADLIAGAVPAELSRDGHIERLALIDDDITREAELHQAWRTLSVFKGVPKQLIRNEVNARRAKRAGAKAAPPDLGDPEPWEEPVELGETLDELVEELDGYIVADRHKLYAAALFCAMTHVHDRLHCMPKLALQSPTKRCGKTTLLDCLSNVVRRPEMVAGTSEAAFIRTSHGFQPTWLMDEADRYLNPKNAGEGLTAALNASSYRRTARKRVCVPAPDGKGWQVVTFEFWCPMILAGIRELTDTIQDRSIVITLQRAMPGEVKARLINGTSPTFHDVQRKLYRWAQDLAEFDLDPFVPKFLHNRAADLWRPLYAIAHTAGGAWPERVRAASEKIHLETGAEENRLVQLLAAIKEVFGGRDRMTTADLVGKLLERDDEPWPTVRRGQPLDAYYLRSTLKGVVDRKTPVIRIGDKTKRGYYRADFELAWQRYLAAESSNASETDETAKPRPGNAHSAGAPGAADEEPASETMRNGDPNPAVTPDGSSASQPNVSDGDASSSAKTKRKKRRKAAGARGDVSDAADVSDGEGFRGRNSPLNGADGRQQAAEQPPCCANCGLAIDADEARLEIAGKLYHSPDCSRWADHRPEVRGNEG